MRAAALRLHAVLLCLFYFVSSINDEAPGEREREREALSPPWGKSARRWAPSPQHHPPPPTATPHDRTQDSLCMCVTKIKDVYKTMFQNSEVSLHSLFLVLFFFLSIEFGTHNKGNMLVITQRKGWH